MTMLLRSLRRGLVQKNPVFVQLLGLCPVLAITTDIRSALVMGAAVLPVLVLCSLFISLAGRHVARPVRLLAYVVFAAGLVSVLDILLGVYLPQFSRELGIFVPLIAVNGIVLARKDAYGEPPGTAAANGLFCGIGFAAALLVVAAFREGLGAGTLAGVPLPIFSENFKPAAIFLLAPGGFLAFGLLLAGFRALTKGKEAK